MNELLIALLCWQDPLIVDLPRFPQSVAKENWLYAVAFCTRLEESIGDGFDQTGELAEVLGQAKQLRDVWDAMDDFARPEFDLRTRRTRGAARLRRLIGEERWESGLLPPPVPVWCFARLH